MRVFSVEPGLWPRALDMDRRSPDETRPASPSARLACSTAPARDLEELESNCLHLSSAQLRPLKTESSDRFHQDVSGRGEEQAKLVGFEIVAAGAICEETQLLLLDPVFHFAALAVKQIVEVLRVTLDIGNHESIVRSLRKTLSGKR